MFKYISNKKSKWYFTKKIKRCLYLYDNYINSLKIINFSISFITNLSEEDWNAWIELLDKIINENNLKDNNEDISSEDKTSNNNTNSDKNILKCKYGFCNNYKKCKCTIKICDNCEDEFITDKFHIVECGDC